MRWGDERAFDDSIGFRLDLPVGGAQSVKWGEDSAAPPRTWWQRMHLGVPALAFRLAYSRPRDFREALLYALAWLCLSTTLLSSLLASHMKVRRALTPILTLTASCTRGCPLAHRNRLVVLFMLASPHSPPPHRLPPCRIASCSNPNPNPHRLPPRRTASCSCRTSWRVWARRPFSRASASRGTGGAGSGGPGWRGAASSARPQMHRWRTPCLSLSLS